MSERRYIVVRRSTSHVSHWQRERELVGPNRWQSLCGAGPRGNQPWVWTETNLERATCVRCIDRLPVEVRQELYPITAATRFVAGDYTGALSHGEAFKTFVQLHRYNGSEDVVARREAWKWFLAGWLAKARQQDLLRGSAYR